MKHTEEYRDNLRNLRAVKKKSQTIFNEIGQGDRAYLLADCIEDENLKLDAEMAAALMQFAFEFGRRYGRRQLKQQIWQYTREDAL